MFILCQAFSEQIGNFVSWDIFEAMSLGKGQRAESKGKRK